MINNYTFALEFKNGVYLSGDIPISDKTLEEKLNGKSYKELAKRRRPCFIEKSSDLFKSIDLTKITNKLLDIEFDNNEYSHWSDIETSFLDGIFNHQKISNEDKKWIYIMLGRLLYPLGLHEQWNLVMFLHGVTHSGKSELLKLMTDIIGNQHVSFEATDSGKKVIALDGSSTNMDKDTMIANIRSNISSNSTMIMITNENPFDSSEDVNDHLFSIEFIHRYEGENINLREKLRNEIGKTVRKINEAYLESLLEYSEHGKKINSELPKSFIL